MMLFILNPQGRLGNLLFQINTIHLLAKEHSGKAIVLASEASDFFSWGKELIVIPCPRCLRKYITKIWICILNCLVHFTVFGIMKPAICYTDNKYLDESRDIYYSKGIFGFIFIVKGFFQYDNSSDVCLKSYEGLLENVEKILVHYPKSNRVGIHLRFGDYKDWSIFGIKDTVLPLTYYLKAFAIIENIIQPQYFIFSDDVVSAQHLMDQTGRKYIILSKGSLIEDFSTMISCSHFILSASSFSWWAAKLIKNENKVLIAPEFWLGFKSNKWYPHNIKTKDFTYINVN